MKSINHHKLIGALMALSMALAACTEERPYKEIFKGDMELLSKSEICENGARFLYLPSTVEASRTTSATRPHWMGEAKIVALKCNENELSVVELDSENQFQDNPTNNLPVLTIPIRHVDFKCSQDADGKCTRSEEENSEISWNQKKFVELKPQSMKVQEVNWLPEQITNLFYPCFNSTGETLQYASVTKDAINIILERTYQSNIQCVGDELDNLNKLGFSVRYHYSLVKLDKVINKDYKPLTYTRGDETTFGFFNTNTRRLDVDNNDIAANDKMLINRWSPGKNIVYHLNDSFLKPENKKLIDATKVAVKNINDTFAKAGTSTRIELKEPTPGLMTGDLRVNSIVLEDDPLAMGVIGYGPSAANPETGEIVHARTVMYLGSIRKYIKATWDDLVNEKLDAAKKEQLKKETGAKGDTKIEVNIPSMKMVSLMKDRHQVMAEHLKNVKGISAHLDVEHAHSRIARDGSSLPVSEKKLRDHATNHHNHKLSKADFMKNPKDLLMMKNCMMSADMADFHGALEKEIEELLKKLGNKTWLELATADRSLVIDTLTPFVWVPVLIHELGHNLGLRHNFGGSEDKENFYTEAEAKAMGLSRVPKYSTVMEYSYSTVNELPVMGKYDIAALRFGYAEKVEVIDPKSNKVRIIDLADLRQDPSLQLKPYKFCTDEHVAVNPNCNVFDEGSTFTEIVQHHIKAYEEGYQRNNFRNGRRIFSQYGDLGYASRIERSFGAMRRTFERYEDIKRTYGLGDDSPLWEQMDFLKDLKGATLLAGAFLTKVLQTPDLMCAISEAKTPNQIIALIPIKAISPNGVDCFDKENVQLNPQYVVVGQAGKLFQSRKDPRSGNPYIDQIDVRGIWIDKLLALHTLVDRKNEVSTFNEFQDNFLDIADIGPTIDAALRGLVLDDVLTNVTIETIFGDSLTVELPLRFHTDNEGENGHRIIDPLDTRVAQVLQIPLGNPTFEQAAIGILKINMPSKAQRANASSLTNAMVVLRSALSSGLPPENLVTVDLGIQRYFAAPQSGVAVYAMLSHSVVTLLDTLGAEKVTAILALVEAGQAPDEKATAEEKQAHALGADILKMYLGGGFQTSNFYNHIITEMANM